MRVEVRGDGSGGGCRPHPGLQVHVSGPHEASPADR